MMDQPRGPTAMARELEEMIATMPDKIAAAPDRKTAKELRRRLRLQRYLLRFYKTRAGYRPASNEDASARSPLARHCETGARSRAVK